MHALVGQKIAFDGQDTLGRLVPDDDQMIARKLDILHGFTLWPADAARDVAGFGTAMRRQ